MKSAKLGLYITLIAFCTACKHEIKAVLPDSYSTETEQYMQRHEYMIVIYVDSSDCTPCSFKHLVQWYSLRDRLEENGVGTLLILRNSDEKNVIRALRSVGTFHFILDSGGTFKAGNEIYKFVKDNIFVMDRNRNVIMAESPVANDRTWNMFTGRIKKKIDLKQEENE